MTLVQSASVPKGSGDVCLRWSYCLVGHQGLLPFLKLHMVFDAFHHSNKFKVPLFFKRRRYSIFPGVKSTDVFNC